VPTLDRATKGEVSFCVPWTIDANLRSLRGEGADAKELEEAELE
jgi:hypothetical protein